MGVPAERKEEKSLSASFENLRKTISKAELVDRRGISPDDVKAAFLLLEKHDREWKTWIVNIGTKDGLGDSRPGNGNILGDSRPRNLGDSGLGTRRPKHSKPGFEVVDDKVGNSRQAAGSENFSDGDADIIKAANGQHSSRYGDYHDIRDLSRGEQRVTGVGPQRISGASAFKSQRNDGDHRVSGISLTDRVSGIANRISGVGDGRAKNNAGDNFKKSGKSFKTKKDRNQAIMAAVGKVTEGEGKVTDLKREQSIDGMGHRETVASLADGLVGLGGRKHTRSPSWSPSWNPSLEPDAAGGVGGIGGGLGMGAGAIVAEGGGRKSILAPRIQVLMTVNKLKRLSLKVGTIGEPLPTGPLGRMSMMSPPGPGGIGETIPGSPSGVGFGGTPSLPDQATSGVSVGAGGSTQLATVAVARQLSGAGAQGERIIPEKSESFSGGQNRSSTGQILSQNRSTGRKLSLGEGYLKSVSDKRSGSFSKGDRNRSFSKGDQFNSGKQADLKYKSMGAPLTARLANLASKSMRAQQRSNSVGCSSPTGNAIQYLLHDKGRSTEDSSAQYDRSSPQQGDKSDLKSSAPKRTHSGGPMLDARSAQNAMALRSETIPDLGNADHDIDKRASTAIDADHDIDNRATSPESNARVGNIITDKQEHVLQNLGVSLGATEDLSKVDSLQRVDFQGRAEVDSHRADSPGQAADQEYAPLLPGSPVHTAKSNEMDGKDLAGGKIRDLEDKSFPKSEVNALGNGMSKTMERNVSIVSDTRRNGIPWDGGGGGEPQMGVGKGHSIRSDFAPDRQGSARSLRASFLEASQITSDIKVGLSDYRSEKKRRENSTGGEGGAERSFSMASSSNMQQVRNGWQKRNIRISVLYGVRTAFAEQFDLVLICHNPQRKVSSAFVLSTAFGVTHAHSKITVPVLVLVVLSLLFTSTREWTATKYDEVMDKYIPANTGGMVLNPDYVLACEDVPLPPWHLGWIVAIGMIGGIFIAMHRVVSHLLILSFFTFDSALIVFALLRVAIMRAANLLECYHTDLPGDLIRYHILAILYLISLWFVLIFGALFVIMLDAFRISGGTKLLILSLVFGYCVYQSIITRASQKGWSDSRDVSWSILTAKPRQQYASALWTMSLVCLKHIITLYRTGNLATLKANFDLVWRNKKTGEELTDIEKVERENELVAAHSSAHNHGTASMESGAMDSVEDSMDCGRMIQESRGVDESQRLH